MVVLVLLLALTMPSAAGAPFAEWVVSGSDGGPCAGLPPPAVMPDVPPRCEVSQEGIVTATDHASGCRFDVALESRARVDAPSRFEVLVQPAPLARAETHHYAPDIPLVIGDSVVRVEDFFTVPVPCAEAGLRITSVVHPPQGHCGTCLSSRYALTHELGPRYA